MLTQTWAKKEPIYPCPGSAVVLPRKCPLSHSDVIDRGHDTVLLCLTLIPDHIYSSRQTHISCQTVKRLRVANSVKFE